MVTFGVAAEAALRGRRLDADAVILGRRDLPGGAAAQFLSSAAFVVAFALLPLVIALYPTGAVPSRRLRWLPPLWAGAVVAEALVVVLGPVPWTRTSPPWARILSAWRRSTACSAWSRPRCRCPRPRGARRAGLARGARCGAGVPAERRALRPFVPVAVPVGRGLHGGRPARRHPGLRRGLGADPAHRLPARRVGRAGAAAARAHRRVRCSRCPRTRCGRPEPRPARGRAGAAS